MPEMKRFISRLSEAACAGLDALMWDSHYPELFDQRLSRDVCFRCPVRAECLEDALKYPSLAAGTIRGGFRFVGAERKGIVAKEIPDRWNADLLREVLASRGHNVQEAETPLYREALREREERLARRSRSGKERVA